METLKQSKFIRDNVVLFVGGVLTGAVNYALYPLISRIVSVGEFGEVQILMSLITQLAIAATVIRIFVVNVVKEKTDDTDIGSFLRNTSRTLLWISSGIALVFLCVSPLLKNVLQFESFWPLVPTAFSVVLGFQFMVPLSHLQSKQRFDKVAWLQLAQAVTKLIAAGGIGYLGFGTAGIIWGVLLSSFAMQWWARRDSRRILSVPYSNIPPAQFVWDSLKKELRYILLISASMGAVTFLLSLDTFFVKAAFSPDEAGLYAGIAVVARTLFFLTASMAGVMISSVKIAHSKQQNVRAYYSSVVLMTVASAAALVVIALVPDIIISVLLGDEYAVHSDLLLKLSVAMYGVGLINIITNYHVAMRERWVVIPALGGLGATALFMSQSVNTLSSAANSFLAGVGMTTVACVVWTLIWNTYLYVPTSKNQHSHTSL